MFLEFLHSSFRNCSIVILERRVFNHFPHVFSFLNFEPLLGAHYFFGGHDFNNLEATVYEDACIVISQTVALKFLKRILNMSRSISMVKFELRLGPSIRMGSLFYHY